MLVNLVFVSRTGEREVYAKDVDLDYFTIRQYRKLYFHLCELNQKLDFPDYVRLSVEPIRDIIF